MKKKRIELAGAGMMLNALDLPMVLRRPFMIIWKMGCGAEMRADRTPIEYIPDVLYGLCGLFWLGLDRVPVCKPLFQGTVGTAN